MPSIYSGIAGTLYPIYGILKAYAEAKAEG
jgi:hypothetical protein